MASALRLIPFAASDGPANMAADELLLEQAQQGQLALRLYGWTPATLSLGYFQPAAERLMNPGWARLPWVRRTTGGGAIHHDEGEVTYGLALPPALAKRHGHAEWHVRLHELMTKMLRTRGVAAEMVGGARPRPSELDFLCFVVPQPGDVVLAGRKIIGGAQRLRGGALLQHGSILPPAAEVLREALPAALAHEFGAALAVRAWTEEERQSIDAIAAAKFRTAAWNCKR